MKKIAALLLALVLSLPLWAQGQVTTRKHRLADFTDKMTKVVLSGNELLMGALRQEVLNTWTSSTFEFCTLEQFEQLKTQDNYYFLIPVESRFKEEEEPGIVLLTLVKGGPEAAKGIAAMHEVVSLPLGAVAGSNGRDLLYVGGIVQAIQDYVLSAMESEAVAYQMSDWFNGRFKKSTDDKDVYIAREDVSSAVTEKDMEKLDEHSFLHLIPVEEVDVIFTSRTPDAVVGYVISPFIPQKGSYCYKLLFEADTHRLCYIHKDKIGPKKSEGFLGAELKKLGK